MVEQTAMSQQTIQEAQALYKEFGDVLYPEYRRLVSTIRKEAWKQPLQNNNYLYSLLLTRIMLEDTNHRFWMLTGGTLDGFFGTLENSFRDMLERVRARREEHGHAQASPHESPVRFLIINERSEISPCLQSLGREFGDVLTIATAKHAKQLPHLIVADSIMVRDEMPHEELREDSRADTVKATVSFYDPITARALEERFEKFWRAVVRAATRPAASLAR